MKERRKEEENMGRRGGRRSEREADWGCKKGKQREAREVEEDQEAKAEWEAEGIPSTMTLSKMLASGHSIP